MTLAARIKCTTTTTGTGTLTLPSTGVRSSTDGDCLAPAERLSVLANAIVSYFIVSGNNFAFGYGTISSNGLSLTRDAAEKSWNGTTFANTPLSLTGTSTVMITPRGEDLKAGSIGVSLAIRMGAFQF